MAVKYTSFSLQKRLLALSLLIIFFLFLLLSRLFYLQVICGVSLQAKASSEWYRDLPTTALRGTITDRNGVVLASSITSYDVYVRPADIDNFSQVALLISSSLNLNYQEVFEKINKPKIGEIKVASKISYEQMQSILKNYQNGIFFSENFTRNYSYDAMLAQLIGFVSSDGDGQTGIEAYYNKYLKGVNGSQVVESDIRGKTLDSSSTYYIEPIDGLNLELTIDFKIQQAVEEIMQECYVSNAASSAVAIVMNAKTSEILSLCTKPSFNLNDVPRDDAVALMQMAKNIAVSDAYEPGSTFKVITLAIALNEKLISAHDYFYCGGFKIVNGVKINCHRKTGHGSQSLLTGLSNSCNCVFMELASKIGVETFYSYLEKFGLLKGYNLDVAGEGRAITVPLSKIKMGDLYRMGFGHAVAVTPLGLANSVCAIANGGNLMQPYFVRSISNNIGTIVYEKQPTLINKVISSDVSSSINNMLKAVVDSGGGKRAKVAGFSIAGKTGVLPI